jgi:hypothetical protein
MSLFPKDDTALVFGEVFKGIDVSLDSAFESILNQLIYKYDTEREDKTSLSDEEVWTKYYRKYFKKIGIDSELKEHFVKTSIDTLKFSKAWQNGGWHCYEPVSFNMKRKEDVTKKIIHWSGVLKWLETAIEPVKVDLLSVMPEDRKQKELIRRALKNQKIGNSTFSIVEENEAEKFVTQLSLEFEEHESNKRN